MYDLSLNLTLTLDELAEIAWALNIARLNTRDNLTQAHKNGNELSIEIAHEEDELMAATQELIQSLWDRLEVTSVNRK